MNELAGSTSGLQAEAVRSVLGQSVVANSRLECCGPWILKITRSSAMGLAKGGSGAAEM